MSVCGAELLAMKTGVEELGDCATSFVLWVDLWLEYQEPS